MHKIIQGIRQFQATVFPAQRELFQRLGQKQQNPLALFITCSDSRINPNLITSTEPGDLFLLRNAGNIIPPYGAANGGEGATIEYAVSVLKVRNIIVCGHHKCGAMQALLNLKATEDLPSVSAWFAHAESTRRIIKENYSHVTPEAQVNIAMQLNVLAQIDNLRTHPCIAVAQARGELSLYGWTYCIETGEVQAYDSLVGRFLPVSEHEPSPFSFMPQLNGFAVA